MSEKRFYNYSGIDLIFYPLSNRITPIFKRLKFSANGVTLLSGFIGILGSIFFSCENKTLILIGSFGYVTYYLLDYVDGNLARLNKNSSISGMFLDIFMGPIIAISMTCAIYLGGRQTGLDLGFNNILLNTLGIIYLLSSLILNSRFAFVWLTISSKLIEDRSQNKTRIKVYENLNRHPKIGKIFTKVSLNLYHENFMIFLLPVIATINYFWHLDLRFHYSLSAIFILLPACLYDVYTFIKYNKINTNYKKIYNNEQIIDPLKTIYLK